MSFKNTRNIIPALLFYLLIPIESTAQTLAPDFIWEKTFGSISYDGAEDVTTDNSGNIIVTGFFNSSLIFGRTILTSLGSSDIFIIKYNSKGEFLWARQAGGQDFDQAWSVAVDKSNNIYVSGSFSTRAIFDSVIISSSGNADAFIAKYSPDGSIQWVRNYGEKGSYEYSFDVTIDNLGNPIITGSSQNFGATVLPYLIFIAKYNSRGQFQWAQGAGGLNGNNIGYATAVNRSNDIFLVGSFAESVDFSGINLTADPGGDVFLAKYTSDGEFNWVKQAGFNNNNDAATDIIIDKNEDIYITGHFRETAQFNDFHLTSVGSTDVFLARYNASGNPVWVRQDSLINDTRATALALDDAGNISVTGFSVDTGSETNRLFVERFNNKGTLLWNKLYILPESYSLPGGIATDTNGDVIVTGSYLLPRVQNQDVLLGKLPSPKYIVSADSIDFGSIESGTSKSIADTIHNISRGNLFLFNASIIGRDAASFRISKNPPSVLFNETSADFNINFSPQSTGEKIANLIIESDAPTSPDTIFLTGSVGSPFISLSQDILNFGNVDIGLSEERSFAITNQSDFNVIISSANVSGNNQSDFRLVKTTIPDTIESRQSKNFTLSFSPESEGLKSAALIILSNTNGSPDTVLLRGTAELSSFTISTDSLNFGTVSTGDSSTLFLTVSNPSSVKLQIDARIAGINSGDFKIWNTKFPDSVNSGSNKRININFKPLSPGRRTAYLILTTNLLGGPDSILLTGTGSIPSLTYSADSLNFGSIDVNNFSDLIFTISNKNSSSVKLDSAKIFRNPQNEFRLFNQLLPDTIEANENKNFTVRFAPVSPGIKSSILVLYNNTATSPDSIFLKGTAISSIIVQFGDTTTIDETTSINIGPPLSFNFTTSRIFYKRSGEQDYDSSPLTQSGNFYTASIPSSVATIRGIQFYIVFSDGDRQVTFPSNDPVNRPATVQVKIPEYTYPEAIPRSRYRMVSVPLSIPDSRINAVLEDDYGPYDNKVWRFFRWETDHYEEFEDINSSVLPGNAFWIISRENKSFDIENSLSVPSNNSYSITLQPGWNQIGNPFAFPVNWNNIENSDLINQEPSRWDYLEQDHDFDETILQPWEGYWVNNQSDEIITLLVPPIENLIIPLKKSNSDNLFLVQVKAKIELSEIKDFQNYVGMNTNAKDTYDRLDIIEPPPMNNDLQLSIISEGRKYARNMVPNSADGNYWHLQVYTSHPDKNITINLENMNSLPVNFKLWLIDEDNKQSLPLINNSTSIIMKGKNYKDLKLIIGTDNYAERAARNITLQPSEYILFQNFPNPFNPQTNIYYALKEKSIVTLEIFDMLGRKIATLINNELKNEGLQNIIWNGTNQDNEKVASGLYIYRLKANNFIDSKKLLLLK